MTAQITNDQQYIAFVRNHATALLAEANSGEIAGDNWNSCYGGAARLQAEAFQDADAGLAKADIEAAQAVLDGLNTWLDEAGFNRRASLMAVQFQPGR